MSDRFYRETRCTCGASSAPNPSWHATGCPEYVAAPARKVNRYKIQQDKGQYCLKGCDDGDLVDYSAYAAMEERARTAEARLHVYSSRRSAVAKEAKS